MAREVSFRRRRAFYLWNRRRDYFMSSLWAGGVVLVIFAAVALVLANLDATREAYHHVLSSRLTVGFDGFALSHTVEEWINDGLMAVFFFVVGLEIKREIIAGQLASVRQAALPVAAAVGGMVVPALIYAVINRGTPYAAGWGVPMATDIAFAIGVLSLLGSRVPVSMKIFLTALAIVDDLGAILVIALFYTAEINFAALAAAACVFLLLVLLNRFRVYRMRYYMIPSLLLWVLFLHSGIHATIAGVLIAMTLPSDSRYGRKYFLYKSRFLLENFRHNDREGVEVLSNHRQFHDLYALRRIAGEAISPMQRLEHALTPVVNFLIMPVFALANAGVSLESFSDLQIFGTTMGAGIFWGLVAGKPLGIVLASWIAIRTGVAVMPKESGWRVLWGVACLGGIGFTMSIFIDNLTFGGTPFVAPGKIAVLAASLCAALLGAVVIGLLTGKSRPGGKTAPVAK